ncbi:MAG: N-acetylmuramoyl-L-alanine amidase [Planctomycetota bacterium]
MKPQNSISYTITTDAALSETDVRTKILLLVLLACGVLGCTSSAPPPAAPGASPGREASRSGDEIVVAGRRFHTGAPVVLWSDPGGYDAYRVVQRFPSNADLQAGHELDGKPRFNTRRLPGDEDRFAARRSGNWTVEELQEVIDQFVIHYDVCGTSRTCFRVLHDLRGLSVHFLLDVDGTIYQTLDIKERAWHATKSNTRSIGIEIANIGAYEPDNTRVLDEWYTTDETGTRMTLPQRFGDGGIRTAGFIARPRRPEPVSGVINGRQLSMYDLTPEQYDSLTKLIATLGTVFPRLAIDAPRDSAGRVAGDVLSDQDFESFQGVLGHFHVQANKVDPGPAFDWDRVLINARAASGSETSR